MSERVPGVLGGVLERLGYPAINRQAGSSGHQEQKVLVQEKPTLSDEEVEKDLLGQFDHIVLSPFLKPSFVKMEIRHFPTWVSVKSLSRLSEATRKGLGFHVYKGGVEIEILDEPFVSRKVLLKRWSQVASYVLVTDHSVGDKRKLRVGRNEIQMTAADALLAVIKAREHLRA